jgi:hypothetical protein
VTDVDWLQWPAMAATLGAAWLVASQRPGKRSWGFWIYLASNALWAAWGIYAHAWALVLLQAGLAAMNVRGVRKNERSGE